MLHENFDGARSAIAHRQRRRVRDGLDERSLQLREEGLDELRHAREEDCEGRQNSRLDRCWEAITASWGKQHIALARIKPEAIRKPYPITRMRGPTTSENAIWSAIRSNDMCGSTHGLCTS